MPLDGRLEAVKVLRGFLDPLQRLTQFRQCGINLAKDCGRSPYEQPSSNNIRPES